MNNKITYDDLIKVSEKLEKAEEKDWDNHVETLYVDYLISIIEGSNDIDELSCVYIDKEQYNKGYNKFYSGIDSALEEALPNVEKEYNLEDEMEV